MKYNGFAYIELMLVLGIILFVSSIGILSYSEYAKRLEMEKIKDQLQSDINWALHYADVKQTILYIFLYPETNRYICKDNRATYFNRVYPPWIKLSTNYPNKRIQFNGDGSVHMAGVISIANGATKVYNLYIQLYSGSVRVEEL